MWTRPCWTDVARSRGGQNPDQDQSLGTAVTWKSARRLSRPRTLHVDDRTSKTLGTPPRGRQGPARDQVGSGKLVALRRRRARTPGRTRFSPVATRQRISPPPGASERRGRGCRGVCFSFLILLGQRIRALTARRGRGMCASLRTRTSRQRLAGARSRRICSLVGDFATVFVWDTAAEFTFVRLLVMIQSNEKGTVNGVRGRSKTFPCRIFTRIG